MTALGLRDAARYVDHALAALESALADDDTPGLSQTQLGALREQLRDLESRVSTLAQRIPGPGDDADAATVRAWARARRLPVGETGRVPREITAMYTAVRRATCS